MGCEEATHGEDDVKFLHLNTFARLVIQGIKHASGKSH